MWVGTSELSQQEHLNFPSAMKENFKEIIILSVQLADWLIGLGFFEGLAPCCGK